jgi:enoyl-CoA hydratase/carnithine racemase
MSALVTWRSDGGLATLPPNKPERLNPMSDALQQSLRTQLARILADTAVRAVIPTAAGRAQTVGADPTSFAGDDSGGSLGRRSAGPRHGQGSRLVRGGEFFGRARKLRQNLSDPGAKRSHGSGYGEHWQRRAGGS